MYLAFPLLCTLFPTVLSFYCSTELWSFSFYCMISVLPELYWFTFVQNIKRRLYENFTGCWLKMFRARFDCACIIKDSGISLLANIMRINKLIQFEHSFTDVWEILGAVFSSSAEFGLNQGMLLFCWEYPSAGISNANGLFYLSFHLFWVAYYSAGWPLRVPSGLASFGAGGKYRNENLPGQRPNNKHW